MGSFSGKFIYAVVTGDGANSDESAEFLLCRSCGVLVAVIYRGEDSVHGAVNSRAVDSDDTFAGEIVVTPKTLDRTRKIQRWQDIWFQDVTIQLE